MILARKQITSMLLFRLFSKDWTIVPCLCRTDFGLIKLTLLRALHTIGGQPIGEVRVVVVDVTSGIHITRIVRVASIRRTQPPIPRSQLLTNILMIIFHI